MVCISFWLSLAGSGDDTLEDAKPTSSPTGWLMGLQVIRPLWAGVCHLQ